MEPLPPDEPADEDAPERGWIRRPGSSFVLFIACTLVSMYLLAHVFWANLGFQYLAPIFWYWIFKRLSTSAARRGVWRLAAPLATAAVILVVISTILFAMGWGEFYRGGGVKVDQEIDPAWMERAEKNFRLSIWCNRLNLSSRHLHGDTLFHLGKFPDSLRSFQRTSRLFPWSSYAHYGRARSLEELGEIEASIEALRRARELNSPLTDYTDFARDFAAFKSDPRFAEFREEFLEAR